MPDGLVAYGADQNLDARHTAIIALGNLGEERAAPALVELLDRCPEPWQFVENYIVRALQRLGGKPASEALQAHKNYLATTSPPAIIPTSNHAQVARTRYP